MSEPIASESQHWYDRAGNPVYEVSRADGEGMRPTNITDARKLDLVPSTTKVIHDTYTSYFIVKYQINMAIDSALTLPRIEGELADDFKKRVIVDAQEHTRKAREKGTELHKAIEDYIRGQENMFWQKHLEKLRKGMEQYGIDLFKGKPEHSFASPLGYGGKVDWHNDEIIIDFKTKGRVADKKTLAWPERCWQLAAYECGLSGLTVPLLRTANVFIGVEDCEIRIHEWSKEDAARGWKAFECLLKFWQIKNNYTP